MVSGTPPLAIQPTTLCGGVCRGARWGKGGRGRWACTVSPLGLPRRDRSYQIARCAGELDAPALYRLIVSLDPVTNAVPSLHCAFATYSVGIASIVTARRWRLGLWLWFALICFSALATNQHMLLDVVTGVALGGGAYLIVWRRLALPANARLP